MVLLSLGGRFERSKWEWGPQKGRREKQNPPGDNPDGLFYKLSFPLTLLGSKPEKSESGESCSEQSESRWLRCFFEFLERIGNVCQI
jgi:hypothetical protein